MNALLNTLMGNPLVAGLFTVLFEKLPFLNRLKGYKTKIGMIIMFIGQLLPLIQAYFPEVPYLDTIVREWANNIGFVITLLGLGDKKVTELKNK